jgi:hypothetical protein
MARVFVPDSFAVPQGLTSGTLRLAPLGPEHNASDHAAWGSSIEHIRSTPGFEGRAWPPVGGMTPDENLDDLRRHAQDFAARRGFTYTVLGADDVVVGCVYIYPSADPRFDVDVRSWVRADVGHLDEELRVVVAAWLRGCWPFERVQYARGSDGRALDAD